MENLHLLVLHPTIHPLFLDNAGRLYDRDRFDIRWNADYTAFRPVRLRWWDDDSYRAYQAQDIED